MFRSRQSSHDAPRAPKRAPIAVVILFTAFSSIAGTISVANLPATGTDAATGIATTNAYLCCIDFGNSTTPPGNINGVPFIHPDLGNQIVNTTNGVDSNHGGSYTITTGGPAACKIARATSTAPGGQADGNTWLMLNDMIYVGSAAPSNSWLNQTYGGLIVGRPYALRIYYRQWVVDTRTINISFNGEGTNQLYSGNPLNQDVGGAHYIEYDFTAATTNVFVGMTNLIDNESAMVYGVTLQDEGTPIAPLITQQSSASVAGSSLALSVAAASRHNSADLPMVFQHSVQLQQRDHDDQRQWHIRFDDRQSDDDEHAFGLLLRDCDQQLWFGDQRHNCIRSDAGHPDPTPGWNQPAGNQL